MNKSNKDTVVIHKLRNFLPCLALLTIYRSFVRSHLDYGDVIYDQPGNGSFITGLYHHYLCKRDEVENEFLLAKLCQYVGSFE